MKKTVLVFAMLMGSSSFLSAQKPGSPAPAISGQTVEGKPIRLRDLKGKVVLVDFWASWCGPCKEEFPFLVRLHEKLKNRGFTVLAVNVDKEAEKMQSFLKAQPRPANFPIISDSEGKFPERYLVQGMPTTILIDKKGVVRYRHTGFKEADKKAIVAEIASLLK